MQVHHIILLVWFIVLAMWLVSQFSAHNRRKDEQGKQSQQP